MLNMRIGMSKQRHALSNAIHYYSARNPPSADIDGKPARDLQDKEAR